MSQNDVQSVTINNESLRVRVSPWVALTTAWKTTLLNGVSLVLSMALLILGYLQTVNLTTILTPTQAVMWTMGVNILTLILRGWGVKPIVLDPPKEIVVNKE